MEDWKTFIGGGVGVMLFIAKDIADGTILSVDYLGSIQDSASLEVPNIGKAVAENLGIFTNSVALKTFFYKKLKNHVFRVDLVEYVFEKDVYYNPTLSQSQVLQLLIADNFNDFLIHADTIQMTAGNGADFLNYLL